MKLLGLDTKHITAIYEKPGSSKIGHYVPGTRIPILSDNEFAVENNAPLLNLAWHISKEINAYMRASGYQGTIVDILNQKDFLLQ